MSSQSAGMLNQPWVTQYQMRAAEGGYEECRPLRMILETNNEIHGLLDGPMLIQGTIDVVNEDGAWQSFPRKFPCLGVCSINE